MEAQEREVEYYETEEGRIPFRDWFRSLREHVCRRIIMARIRRVTLGNLGQSRSVGEGVMELKIDFGPGYRVYFGQIGTKLIILLSGGDKGTQHEDIKTAQEYWADYRRRNG
jgi:putative addiction module killer protein